MIDICAYALAGYCYKFDKVVELSLEAKVLKAELESYAKVSYDKAIELSGEAESPAMVARD